MTDVSNSLQGAGWAKAIASNVVANTAANAIPTVASVRSTGKLMTGARCRIRINNKIVAFAFSATWTIQTSQDEINVIDEYLPTELAPKRMRCFGTIGMFRVPGEGANVLEFQPNMLSFLFHKYVSIEIVDKKTNNILFFASHAVITDRTESITAENNAQAMLSFQAIGFQDELNPTLPSGVSDKII